MGISIELTLAALAERGDQILGAREDVVVRIDVVQVARQALVGLPGDARHRESESEAEGAVAAPAVVRELKLRAEPAAAGRRGERNGERRGARRRVDRELLADAADGTSALRQGERGQQGCPPGSRPFSSPDPPSGQRSARFSALIGLLLRAVRRRRVRLAFTAVAGSLSPCS